MKTIIKVLFWNMLLILAGVVAIELTFGGWIIEDPFQKMHIPTNVSRQYDLDGLYPGREFIHYTRDKYGLRGEYPSPAEIDVLTIGGSTTDQAYISDGETWQDVMASTLQQKGYDLNVVNGGIDGQSTYGHLKSFEWWFPKISGFKPKVILYYVGINDIYVGRSSYRKDGLMNSLREKSVFYKIASLVRGAIVSRKYKIGHGMTDFASLKWTTMPISNGNIYDVVFDGGVDEYRQRIQELVERTEAIGAVPVFATQQTRISRKKEGVVEGVDAVFELGGYPFNGVDRYYILEKYNEALRSVCRELGVECFDISQDIQFVDSDFYDYMHNTPAGAKKIGRYLAAKCIESHDNLGFASSHK